MREITEALFALRDEKYRAFHATLMPGVAWERVIGSCPTPTTRKIISMPCC